VGTRGGYYDHAGALRDMVPNHLLALLSTVAMEPANSVDGNAVVLTQTVRGQYAAGDTTSAYRDEEHVEPDSTTETFVAMKLMIDTWRWAGVPFYIRTGKRMPGRYTEIVVQFKPAPNMMFHDSLVRREQVPPKTQPG